jgi:DNA-directed RNA polymerase subunit RPC12/RpoP
MDGASESVRRTLRVEVMAVQDSDAWALRFLADGRLVHDEPLSGPEGHDPDYIQSRVESFLESLGDVHRPERVQRMRYTGVKCRPCGELIAVGEVPTGPRTVSWIRPSWKGRLTCPKCGATHDYTGDDPDVYEGNVEAR